MRQKRFHPIYLIIVFLLLVASGCLGPGGMAVTTTPKGPAATQTLKIASTLLPTITPTHPCPQATPELPPRVEPLTSPTDQTTQLIRVSGFFETITITTESGTFTGDTSGVEITLLPNTVHHLMVTGKVPHVEVNGCSYGGYTLNNQVDLHGKPLVIIQGEPKAARPPSSMITADNLAKLELLASIPFDQPIEGLFFNGNQELITFGSGQKLTSYELPSATLIGELGDQAEYTPLCATASADGRYMASGGGFEDYAVRLYDLSTGKVTVLGKQDAIVVAVAFSPDSKWLASGINGNKIFVWNVTTGQLESTLEGDTTGMLENFESLKWLDGETLLAMGAYHAYRWDAPAGTLLEKYAETHLSAFIVQADFTKDGKRMAAAAQDENVYVWNAGSAQWEPWGTGVDTSIARTAFSPDGSLLAAFAYDNSTFFWEVSGGNLLAAPVTTQNIDTISFSPDGRYLALLAWDGLSLELWGVP